MKRSKVRGYGEGCRIGLEVGKGLEKKRGCLKIELG